MTVFGHALSVTFVLQVITTTIILGLYAITDVMHLQKADHLSNRFMVLMATFLFNFHPKVTDIEALMDVGERKIKPGLEDDTHKFFVRIVKKFQETGELPALSVAASDTAKERLMGIALAPIFAIAFIFVAIDYNRPHLNRMAHTVFRKNVVSHIMMLLAVNIFVGFILAEFLLQRHPVLCLILLALPCAATISSLITFSIVATGQQQWKEYWSDRLLEVMAVAAHDKNHDLFNRALFLKNDVESQPDLPIPGKLSLYTTVFSVVQFAILFSARVLHFS